MKCIGADAAFHDLLQLFASQSIGASAFETRFLQLRRSKGIFSFRRRAGLIDRLMVDVDAFCSDPELRDVGDLDERQLLDSARKILGKW
jgi:hypothetical protein